MDKVKIMQSFNYLKWGTLVLLATTVLLPKFPLFTVPGTYVAIRYEDFLIAFLGLLFFFSFLKKKENFLKDTLNLAILVYLLVVSLSLIVALLFPYNGITPHIGFLHWLRRIEYFIPFYLTIFAITSVKDSYLFLSTLLGTSFFVFLYGIGQLFFKFPVISTTNEEFSKGLLLPLTDGARINATFAGQFDLAAYLAIILCLFTALFFGLKVKNYNGKLIKILIFIFAIASYWLLLQSGSRVSLVAFIVGSLCLLIILKKRFAIISFLVFCSLGFIIPSETSQRLNITFKQNLPKIQKLLNYKHQINNSILVSAQENNNQEIINWEETPEFKATITAKTERPAPGEPSNLDERIVFRSQGIRFNVEWPRAMRALLKNPLLGTGVSSISLATDNDYLRSLGETGLLGFLAFLAIFAEIIRRVIVFFKHKNDERSRLIVAGIFGVIVAMLINAIFIDIFEASKIAILFWLLMGVLIKTISLAYEKNN